MCGARLRKTAATLLIKKKAQLIDSIKEAFEVLPRDILKAECTWFWRWIKDVVDVEDGFFQEISFDCYNLYSNSAFSNKFTFSLDIHIVFNYETHVTLFKFSALPSYWYPNPLKC